MATFDTYCIDYNLKTYEHSSLKQPIANQAILRLIQLLKHSIAWKLVTDQILTVHSKFVLI